MFPAPLYIYTTSSTALPLPVPERPEIPGAARAPSLKPPGALLSCRDSLPPRQHGPHLAPVPRGTASRVTLVKGELICASQRSSRPAPSLGPVPLPVAPPPTPILLIPLRAQLSPTTSTSPTPSSPPPSSAVPRLRLPRPRERRISGFALARERDHLRGPPPRPRRRGVGDRLDVGGRRCPSPAPPGGDLSPRVPPLDAGKFRRGSARNARAASGAPLAGIAANHAFSAPRRRPGRGPGPCTRRGFEHRGGGGEAEPFPCRQPLTCVRAEPRPPPPPPMTLRSAESLESTEGSRARWGHPGTAAPVAEEFCEAAQLATAMEELRRAGWYWGNMTVAEAKERLQDAPEGTFLVRDSSHSEYLLTISVKTSAGPTNLRIEYQDGKFRLDSITCVRSRLKQFNSVVHLIEYYVLMCKNRTEAPSNGTVHLYLNKPLYTSTPSLQHRCRITINKCTTQIWELPLPTRLKEYLKEYQYQE
uniref:Suppressor of cytokine signaling 2 n=1 Tax=Amazona collaria TaxID=241587 RepID=A0A8B9FIR2_9PSIT